MNKQSALDKIRERLKELIKKDNEEDPILGSFLRMPDEDLVKVINEWDFDKLKELFPEAPPRYRTKHRLAGWCIDDIRETKRFIRIERGYIRKDKDIRRIGVYRKEY